MPPEHTPTAATAPSANMSDMVDRVVNALLKEPSVSLKDAPTFSGRFVSNAIEASRPPTPVNTFAVAISW